MGKRIVIVGGVAGGATAAARARRLDERAEITLVERGPYVSFANCGLPYFLGGEITDRDKLNQYLAGAPASLAGRELKLLAFTETADTIEGVPPGSRVVVIQFPDKQAALDWYNSPEYQAAVALRAPAATGDVVIIEGYEGPQPGQA